MTPRKFAKVAETSKSDEYSIKPGDPEWPQKDVINAIIGCLTAYPDAVDGMRDFLENFSQEELANMYTKAFGRPMGKQPRPFPPSQPKKAPMSDDKGWEAKMLVRGASMGSWAHPKGHVNPPRKRFNDPGR